MNNTRNYKKKRATIKPLVGLSDDVLPFDNSFDSFPPTLFTVPEIAEFLNISASGVRRLQQHRVISFIKVGGSVRFSKEDVLSYLQKQRVKTVE